MKTLLIIEIFIIIATQSCLRVGMKVDSVLNAYHKRQRAAERERGSMLQSSHITSSQYLRQNSGF